jgi:hypothetical protein
MGRFIEGGDRQRGLLLPDGIDYVRRTFRFE